MTIVSVQKVWVLHICMSVSQNDDSLRHCGQSEFETEYLDEVRLYIRVVWLKKHVADERRVESSRVLGVRVTTLYN